MEKNTHKTSPPFVSLTQNPRHWVLVSKNTVGWEGLDLLHGPIETLHGPIETLQIAITYPKYTKIPLTNRGHDMKPTQTIYTLLNENPSKSSYMGLIPPKMCPWTTFVVKLPGVILLMIQKFGDHQLRLR